jgi:hypothetical protein
MPAIRSHGMSDEVITNVLMIRGVKIMRLIEQESQE